jgi:hypothetical protein
VGIVVLVMIGVVWKSNSDRKAREEALALQTQQHNQKMAQIEAENQARLAQEAKDKPKKSKLVLRAINKQRLNRRILIKIIKLLVIKLLLSKVKAIRLLVTILSRNINTPDAEWMNIYKSASKTARAIMNSRQKGSASMSDMMERIMATDAPAEIKKTIKPFVLAAYERPRFSTPEFVLKAEIDFENEAYLTCMSARS